MRESKTVYQADTVRKRTQELKRARVRRGTLVAGLPSPNREDPAIVEML